MAICDGTFDFFRIFLELLYLTQIQHNTMRNMFITNDQTLDVYRVNLHVG